MHPSNVFKTNVITKAEGGGGDIMIHVITKAGETIVTSKRSRRYWSK